MYHQFINISYTHLYTELHIQTDKQNSKDRQTSNVQSILISVMEDKKREKTYQGTRNYYIVEMSAQ